MNVILCDDEKLFLDSVEQKIRNWAEEHGHMEGLIIRSFTSAEEMLEAYNHGLRMDALFMDIVIPGEMSGMAAAREMRAWNECIPIVFMTGYSDYAEEGYAVSALRYIRKPITQQAVDECMNLIWRQWLLREMESIIFDQPRQVLRLSPDQILYVEISGHYCIIKTADSGQVYKLRLSMEQVCAKLPGNLFVQCHRSYIINLLYIRSISNGKVILTDNSIIRIGRSYQQELITKFRCYYLKADTELC